MITNIYVDGFNLYYRALKDTLSNGLTCADLPKRSFLRTPFIGSAISLHESMHGLRIPRNHNGSRHT